MKRILLCCATFASFAASALTVEGNMIDSMTQNEGITAVPCVRPVTIDGDLSEWDLSGEIWSFADYDVRDQYSVKTAAMWDKDFLYLSFRWKDPLPMNSDVTPDDVSNRMNGWLADSVQMRIVAGKNKPMWLTTWWYKNRATAHLVYWKRPDTPGKDDENIYHTAKPGTVDLGAGIRCTYRMLPSKDGFTQEMKVPWNVIYKQCGESLAAAPALKAGDKLRIAFEFKWGDVSGKAWPAHQFSDNLQPGVTQRGFLWTNYPAWGDVVLSGASVPKKREYVRKVFRPEGVFPVRAKIPRDAKTFTIVIEDKDGNRIRNLAGGYDASSFRIDSDTVEVKWDLLDDAGRLVPAGDYRVRGLTHQGLSSRYVMSFYNPGIPPWVTPDNRGAWGSDHSRLQFAARSGDNVLLSGGFVETGCGAFCLGSDLKKRWSHIRGVIALAANDRHLFVVPNGWHTKEEALSRYDAATGEASPFVRDGKVCPQDLPLTEIFGREPKRLIDKEKSKGQWGLDMNLNVLGLAAGPNRVLMALAGGVIAELDAETARVIAEHKIDYDFIIAKGAAMNSHGVRYDQVFTPLAFDGTSVYFYRKGKLTAFDIGTKAFRTIETGCPVERPTALALGPDGTIYVADDGADKQVKRFDASGRFLGAYGKKGGRPRVGKFDKEGMRDVSSITVDAKGNVWAVEFTDYPRRVSVWGPDGKLFKDFIGNTGYCGVGGILHDQEVGRAFVGPNEFRLDEKNFKYEMMRVIANPPHNVLTFGIPTGANEGGHCFYSTASGKKRDYFYRTGTLFMADDKGDWRCVAAATTVGDLLKLFKKNVVTHEASGEYSGLNAFDIVVWNDGNGDGIVQRAECEIMPNAYNYKVGQTMPWFRPRFRAGWGSRMDPGDLTFYMGDGKNRWMLTPVAFGEDGAPKYSVKGMKAVSQAPLVESLDMHPVPGEDTLIAFTKEGRRTYMMGVTKDFGKVKWTYPDPYDNVHGSHAATMPRPGLLIGPLKVTGVVKDCGDAKGVFMLRGNLGSDFYVTTDGLYVDSMFKDCRLPSPMKPDSEEKLRAMPFNLFSMGGEPFNGWIGRQADGEVRMLCGIAQQASCLVKIDGLDAIRYFTAPDVAVDEISRVKANADNIARAKNAERAKPYEIRKVEGGKPDWKRIPGMKIEAEGQPVKGICRLAYDDRTLYARFDVSGDDSPWANNGKEIARMFKTGDCVDLCLSPTGNAGGHAKEGDARIVTSPYDGRNASVILRKVFAKARPGERVQYLSPVRAFEMAQVKEIAQPKVTVNKNGCVVSLELPWAEFGVTPKSGMKLRGDAGMILSDAAGTVNLARVYYANKQTNLVNDLPGEADLYPNMWADFILK